MDRLFLDANILFSAAYRSNAGLMRFWKLKHVSLCSSRYALEEARINLTKQVQKERLEKLARRIRFFEARPQAFPATVSLPEKDLPILLAAMEAKATHLITGDVRHFGPYFGQTIEGILIVSPSSYLRSRQTT